ncbi:hypothetical protein [Nocardia beijingensis]|uniref:hypothetical protein n=1 Tax=Nocardia beijingensis TaxID=95162 RepID=UPI003400BEA8
MTASAQASQARFRAEADMLQPLIDAAPSFGRRSTVLFEVPCTAGVPDIVLLELDDRAMRARVGAAPLEDSIDVRVMVITAQVRNPTATIWTADRLAELAGVTSAHLRRTVLPRLAGGGHLREVAQGWQPTHRYRSLARRVVTIEAKLRDWRGAVAQAARHTAVADAAWVALDEASAAAAQRNSDWFSAYGVGLATVCVDGTVTHQIKPGVSRTGRFRFEREFLVERSVALHQAGRVSGELPCVFGRTLVATTGSDPRLVSAGAH